MSINPYEETNSDNLRRLAPIIIGIIGLVALIFLVFWGISSGLKESSSLIQTVDGSSFIRDYNFVEGNADSELKVVYLFDLQCPACRSNHTVMNQLKEEYGDRLGFVYKNFPIASIHPQAKPSAYAAHAAGELIGSEAYFQFVDRIYELQNQLSNQTYEEIASQFDMDIDAWNNLRNGSELRNKIEQDLLDIENFELPLSEYSPDSGNKASATPTTLIFRGNEVVAWWSGGLSLEEFKVRIEPFLSEIEGE